MAALAILVAASGLAEPSKLPPDLGKYLLVLWEPGSPLPDGSPGQVKKFADPDIAKLGGTVLSKNGNQQVILLPLKEAKKLRRHDAVKFLQRVWMGESLEDWDESIPVSFAMTPRTESEPNLEWGPKAYTYDGSGNIKSIGADNYTYDTAGRLIQATVGGKTETFKYDAFGNLLEKAIAGSTPVTIPVDGGSNRIIGPEYDAAGNFSSDAYRKPIVYDSFNLITKISPPSGGSTWSRAIYDANDERIGTILDNSGLSRWTFRDFDGQIIREYREGGLEWTWVQDYIFANGRLVAGETQQFTYSPGGAFIYGGHRHYHLDHLGSVRMVTSDAGRSLALHDYYAFGNSQTAVHQEPLNDATNQVDGMRFAGQWRDFLGQQNVESNDYLDYMHARYYDPNRGRFLSVDPVINAGVMESPQMWNRYSYTANNPMNRTDPDGRNWFSIDGTWEWHKGSKYKDADGVTHKSNYTHLLVAQATGTKNGTTTFNFTLYNQNKVAMTGTGFSGGTGLGAPIGAGNYKIRTDIRDATGPNAVNPNSPDGNPPVFYGMQAIRPGALPNPANGLFYDIRSAYGPMRAYLNPMGGQTDRGLFFHGQESTAPNAGQTHGCLCYGQNPAIINYLWKLTPQQVPVAVDVPVTPP
jgi:RHS repeat-associated protein